MNNDIFTFEISDGATGDIGGGGDAPAIDTTPAPEAPAAPSYSLDDPGFREAIAPLVAEVAQAQLQQYLASSGETGQQYEPEGAPTLDPFADDYGEQLAALMAQQNQQMFAQVQQLLQPIIGQHQQQVEAEGQQRITEIISNIATDLSEPGKGAVEEIAPMFLEQFERTYGQGPRAAEAALAQAAKVIRNIETAAATSAVERYKSELSSIGSARGIPAGGSVGVESGPRPTSILDAGRRFAERHNAGVA